MRKVLIIHPNDKSTGFLNRIKRHLLNEFSVSLIHHFNVKSTAKSHLDCLSLMKTSPHIRLIIFLGHGTSIKLYGAKGRSLNPLLDAENPSNLYENNNFISEANIDVFKGKIIFCLACNSNAKLAKAAVEKGALCFIGFGNIPSSLDELREEGEKEGNYSLLDTVRELKTELNYIIKKSLELAIRSNATVEQLVETIKFITNRRIVFILKNKKSRINKVLYTYLSRFKNDIVIVGNKKISLNIL